MENKKHLVMFLPFLRFLSFYSKKTLTSKVGDELRLYLLDRMRYCIDWHFHH